MNNSTFSNINKIIERDSKVTTYKFALLRGTIDIIIENSPYIKINRNTVEIPLGLLIEKWLIYYYPLLNSKYILPQINGENNSIAFQNQFDIVIKYYNECGGLSAFYNDIRSEGISPQMRVEFINLVKKLKDTITTMPMKYIGRSISNDYYSIYKYYPTRLNRNIQTLNIKWLINSFGFFTIPVEYYEAFKILGSFISGTDNILFKWAEFTTNASHTDLKTEQVLNEILKSPVSERDVEDVRKVYTSLKISNNNILCVWSNQRIDEIVIDHMIPFSIWKNNDFWNLLPSRNDVNSKKSDKIPSNNILIKQKDLIIYYWETLYDAFQNKFIDEIEVSLLGNHSISNWQNSAFDQLLNTSKYLIETRGHEEWEI